MGTLGLDKCGCPKEWALSFDTMSTVDCRRHVASDNFWNEGGCLLMIDAHDGPMVEETVFPDGLSLFPLYFILG